MDSCKGDFLIFGNCIFDDGFSMQDNRQDVLLEEFVSKANSVISVKESFGINKCYFSDYLDIWGLANSYLRISKSKFSSVLKPGGEFREISLVKDTFNFQVNLTSVIIRDAFIFKNSIISDKIVFDNIFYPIQNSTITWQNMEGHICSSKGGNPFYPEPYLAKTDKELADDDSFNELIAIHSKLLAVFKFRGDQDSYNACYVNMKDIQTRKSGYLYRKYPSIKTFFDYQLNQFLRTFCEYGTYPVRSIIYSFYVILLFSLLYFIFPSQDDNLKKSKVQKTINKVISYFTTDKKLAELSEDKRMEELIELNNFKLSIDESRKHVPKIVRIIAKPYYSLSYSFYNLNVWFLKRVEILPGIWDAQSKSKKILSSIALGAYLFLFIISGFTMRIINAIIMSLNSFVTLGYGEVTALGIARYLAVIEGAIGYFLLSIFIVSLISQLLQ